MGVNEGYPKTVRPKRLTSSLTILCGEWLYTHNSVKEGTMPNSLSDLNLVICSEKYLNNIKLSILTIFNNTLLWQ